MTHLHRFLIEARK